MSVETPTWINDLVIANPGDTDTANFGAAHLRNLKTALKNTLPSYTHAVGMPFAQAKSTNYAVVSTDEGSTILVDATAGAVNITLLAASTWNGFRLTVKKTDSTTNIVTVLRVGSDTIDGATSYVIRSQLDVLSLISNGTATWHIVDNLRNIGSFNFMSTDGGGTTMNWMPRAAFAGTIIRISAVKQSGSTFTLQFRINGIDITNGSLTLNTNGVFTTVPTANNVFAIGDTMEMIRTGVGSSNLMSFAIDYIRT